MTTDLPAEVPVLDTNSKNWATMTHLSAFIQFLGVPAIVGPLVVWLMKRDDPYVDYHGKEALNFNISFILYGIVSAILVILLIGLLLLPVVFLLWFIFTIVASVKASGGEYYRYPMTIRFLS